MAQHCLQLADPGGAAAQRLAEGEDRLVLAVLDGGYQLWPHFCEQHLLLVAPKLTVEPLTAAERARAERAETQLETERADRRTLTTHITGSDNGRQPPATHPGRRGGARSQ